MNRFHSAQIIALAIPPSFEIPIVLYNRIVIINKIFSYLFRQAHDTVHQISVVLLESSDGLGAVASSLGHDQFNVLGVKASFINGLGVSSIAGLFRLRSGGRGSGLLGSTELLSSGSLAGAGLVLGLGLTEDNVGLGVGALEDIRLVDGEQDVFGLLDGDAQDSRNRLHTELEHGLSGLLLVTVLDRGGHGSQGSLHRVGGSGFLELGNIINFLKLGDRLVDFFNLYLRERGNANNEVSLGWIRVCDRKFESANSLAKETS